MGLKSLGHDVTIISPRYRIKEMKLSTIPFRHYKEFDLVHLHGPTPFLSDLALMTSGKYPIIYTHHAEISWFSEELSGVYRSFHRKLTRRANTIVVHSNDYASLFKTRNVVVIHMPSSFSSPRNKTIEEKKRTFTVLYVGQFRPFKGIIYLLKAASILRDIKFILVGEGYLRPRLMRIFRNLKNVTFTGSVSDEILVELYEQSHIICLPSINTTEAYGLVLIEGALHGCVPIASDLLGVRENIKQLKGMLFEPKSYISLVQTIRHLSNNRMLWRNKAIQSQEAACTYASVYTPQYYVQKHEELFKKCLQKVKCPKREK